MPHSTIKNKNFSFNPDGSLNQFGLKSIIQEISPKLLRPAVKYTLMIASEHATASAQMCIFKSLQNIADECGISKDTARRHLRQLTEMGILHKQFVIDKQTGKQKPCLYTYTPLFIRIAKGFRRYADKLKSRRQQDFKAARSRFNILLESLVFRAKIGLSSLKNKIFSKGYPSKTALKQGLQNTTQEGSKTAPNKVFVDQVNKYPAGDISQNHASDTAEKCHSGRTSQNHKNGAVHFFQDILERFSAISNKRNDHKKKTTKHFKLEQSEHGKQPAKPAQSRPEQAISEGFNHARYREANRVADEAWKERDRISRQSSPEKTAAHLANLRALLNNAQAKKAGK